MSYAIGCIGTSADNRTGTKVQKMTREQRERNAKLVPKRNQSRGMAIAVIRHEDGTETCKAVRDGHLHNVKTAFCFSTVQYLEHEGKRLVVPVKRGK